MGPQPKKYKSNKRQRRQTPKICCNEPNLKKRGLRGSAQRFSCTSCKRWQSIDAPKPESTDFYIRKRPLDIETGIVKRVIVTPDKHFPIADLPAIRCVKKIIEKSDADIYVDLGDTLEHSSVSHWERASKPKIPLDLVIEELDAEAHESNQDWDFLDESLDKAGIKERYITLGNHDNWLDKFLVQHPHLNKIYNFKKLYRMDQRGYKMVPFGEFLRIGKLHFYHGHHVGGVNHTRAHLLRFGVSILYGHHHSVSHYEVGFANGVNSATSLGCLKMLGHDANQWLNNLKHSWGHACASVDYYDDGNYCINIHRIIEGKVVFHGELMDGNA